MSSAKLAKGVVKVNGNRSGPLNVRFRPMNAHIKGPGGGGGGGEGGLDTRGRFCTSETTLVTTCLVSCSSSLLLRLPCGPADVNAYKRMSNR